jgi:hypothetical protein
MNGELSRAHATHQHRHRRQRLARPPAGANERAFASMDPLIGQEAHHLFAARHVVRLLHLHSAGWNEPCGASELDFVPRRAEDLRGSCAAENGEHQRLGRDAGCLAELGHAGGQVAMTPAAIPSATNTAIDFPSAFSASMRVTCSAVSAALWLAAAVEPRNSATPSARPVTPCRPGLRRLRPPAQRGDAGPNRARCGYSATACRTATRGLNTNSPPEVQSDLKSLYESTSKASSSNRRGR